MFAAFVTGTKTELLLLFFGEREKVLRDENDRCEKDAKTEEEENDRDEDEDEDEDATTTTAAAIPWEMMMIFYTKSALTDENAKMRRKSEGKTSV